MYCKNCGKEQKNGQKFCPKCGTPFAVADDCLSAEAGKETKQTVEDGAEEQERIGPDVPQNGSEVIDEQVANVTEEISNQTETQEADNKDQISTDSENEQTAPKKNSAAKNVVWALLGLCLFFGIKYGLNSDKAPSSSSSDYNYSARESSSVPDWLTLCKFSTDPSNGVSTSLSFHKNGTVVSSAYDRNTGDRMRIEGTYTLSGHNVSVSLNGGPTLSFTLDESKHRVVSSSGAIFKQDPF